MNNLENHCKNDSVKSSYANTMSAAQVYYPPNQTEVDMTQNPTERWFQYQQQQAGISPSSSGLSRADSYSPCSTPMNNQDDNHIQSSCAPSFSSPSHHVALIDPMVFGKNNGSATAVTSASQHQSAYQQPMVMPLFQPETQAHHEKLLFQYNNNSHSNNHGSMAAVNYDMNAHTTNGLDYSASAASSNMYYTRVPNGMIPSDSNSTSNNSIYVSYRHDYTNQQATYINNQASTSYPSVPAFPMNTLYNNQQLYSYYVGHSRHDTNPTDNSAKLGKLCEIKCNSHHQQNNHLMTTIIAKEDDACVSSSTSTSSTSDSYGNSSGASSSSSNNNMNGIEHKQTNNTQASFPCSEPGCYKKFLRPYNLKSHMKTHTQERPHVCTYKPCHWTFARFHDLKRHELQHTGLKPHGCHFCLKRFARSDALKRHWKVDPKCAEAWKQDIALNGGTSVKMRRNKSKGEHKYQALN
ncbi:hypothetical protein BD408DRAFT_439928 [Parasitella parasitica]|nr:hypothetical protein BD408DRAFT_439928 [Parasitella parasitica]